MKKIIDFINKYKYQILLIFIYFLFFLHMQNVHMYADDFVVAAMYRDYPDLFSIIFGFYYKYWSGRLIGHTVTSIIIGFFGINSFRLLNPLFLFMFCYYISKLINIKNKYNIYMILFYVTLIFLGINVSISNEFLYWADGTILYLWVYVLMLIVMYFIMDSMINKKKLSIFRFCLSILFIFIISFSMESIAIILLIFLSFVFINSFIRKKFNKPIFILLFISFVFLFCSYLVPGNSYRFSMQNEIFFKANYLEKIIIKLPEYFTFLFSSNIFSFIFIMSIVISLLILKQKNKILKVFSVFLVICNVIFIINFKFFTLFDVSKINILLYIFLGLYLIINFILIFVISKNENYKYYSYIIFGSIAANFVSVILIEYTSIRFFFPIILSFIIFLFSISFNNKKYMKLILYLFIFLFNYILALVLLMLELIIIKYIKNEKKYINNLVIVFCIINIFNFSITFYKYFENSKIIEYNEKQIEFAKKNGINLIRLKKMKYENYCFQLPPEHDYVLPWYVDYYQISNYTIEWID